ncbi:MAG: exodeoxyribonuclease VII small subunit [Planctomycetales bacterium]
MSDSNSLESNSFEESLQQLQQIVQDLENGQTGLEDSLQKFEHGIRLLRDCHQRLAQAEQKSNSSPASTPPEIRSRRHSTPPVPPPRRNPAAPNPPPAVAAPKKAPHPQPEPEPEDDDGTLPF